MKSAITTEKKVINPVANISGFEKTAGLLKTKVWSICMYILLVIRTRKGRTNHMLQLVNRRMKLLHAKPLFSTKIPLCFQSSGRILA